MIQKEMKRREYPCPTKLIDGSPLKKDNFNIIGDLIRYNKRLDSLGYPQYWRGEVDCINNALKSKGLSLYIRIPAQVVKKDILHELLYELSYEDACKYLLKLRTLSEPK